jgi:inner membrane protein
VENLTHSLIGAALAEVALPRDATRSQRTLFFVSGIIAANLPDADLVYTSITPPPLGYLLHHRGHTHTVAGIIVLAALFGVVSLIPALRRVIRPVEPRYGLLVIGALASHLVADSWNSYGVHPFWPLDNRWFYGDAIYIADPWLWMLLGVSVAMNTRSDRGRLILSAVLIGIPIAAAAIGLVSPLLLPIASVAALFVLVARRRASRTRAWMSIAAASVFVATSFVVERGVGLIARVSLATPPYRHLVDLVLNPSPANPLCWSALAIEEAGDSLYLRRTSIDPLHELVPLRACGGRSSGAWTPVATQSLADLRRAMAGDCRVRAWLQFGRAPVMADGWITDARFGGTGRGNFTAMPIASEPSGRDCPAHLTDWDLPRADVLLSRAAPPSRSP